MVYKINLISNDIKKIIRKAINIFLLFNLFSFIVTFHITINTYLEFQIEKISNFYNTQNVLELEKKQDEILREAIGLYGLKTVYKLDNNNYMKDLCFPLDSLKEINYISISKYCLIYDNKTIYLGFFFPSDSQRTFLMVVENSDLIWRFIILGILIMILDFIYFTLFLVYIGYRAKYLEANNIYKYEVNLSNKVNSTLTENIHHELKTPLLVLTESISSIVGIVEEYKLRKEDYTKIAEFRQIISLYSDMVYSILEKMRDLKSVRHNKSKLSIYEIITIISKVYNFDFNSKIEFIIDNDLKYYYLEKITGEEFSTIIEVHIKNSLDANATKIEFKVNSSIGVRHLIMLIIDNGKGIDDKIKNNIYQLNFSSKDTVRGFGLYFSKSLLQEKDGDEKLEYTGINKGTIFSMKIPIITKRE